MERIVDLKIQHPDSEIIDLMIDGEISPEMNYEASGRHIRDRIGLEHADDFKPNKSEILATAPEVDRIVSRLIGSGKIKRFRSSYREIIHISELDGVVKGGITQWY